MSNLDRKNLRKSLEMKTKKWKGNLMKIKIRKRNKMKKNLKRPSIKSVRTMTAIFLERTMAATEMEDKEAREVRGVREDPEIREEVIKIAR